MIKIDFVNTMQSVAVSILLIGLSSSTSHVNRFDANVIITQYQ